MVNLKLAEYNEGKFLRFLELGEEFWYAGQMVFVLSRTHAARQHGRDKADPLIRFNGLFDGRTYGEGRFVLIEKYSKTCWQDDFFRTKEPDGSCRLIVIAKVFYEINQWRSYAPKYRIYSSCLPHTGEEISIGNLHQSPELFKELKRS